MTPVKRLLALLRSDAPGLQTNASMRSTPRAYQVFDIICMCVVVLAAVGVAVRVLLWPLTASGKYYEPYTSPDVELSAYLASMLLLVPVLVWVALRNRMRYSRWRRPAWLVLALAAIPFTVVSLKIISLFGLS